MTPLEVLVGVTTATVIAAVLGEAVWLRLGLGLRSGSGPGAVGPLPTAALMLLGATPAAMLLTRVDRHLWPALGSLSPAPLRSFWLDHPALAAVAAFVAWDAAGWCYHRLGHRSAVGWAAHRVHHSGTQYDMTLAWRQSWFPLHAVVAFSPVALLGVELTTVAGCAAVSKLWQALVHTSLPVRLPRALTAAVMTPATHRRHHTIDGGGSNLGPVLTIWDRLAGTWDPTPPPEGAAVGLRAASSPRPGRPETRADRPETRADQGALRIETEGWLQLARRFRGVGPVHPPAPQNRPAPPTRADYGWRNTSMRRSARRPSRRSARLPAARKPTRATDTTSVRLGAHGPPLVPSRSRSPQEHIPMTTTDPLAADRTSNADTQPHELTPAQLVELTELLTQERAALSIPPPEGDVDLADDPGARLSAREAIEALNVLQAAQLEKIDHALSRIEEGTYGTCEGCGVAIPAARLEVMPSATFCVECQATSGG